MNQIVRKQRPTDPEELGYQTMRECRVLERAKIICGLLLQADENVAQGNIDRLTADIADAKYKASSLHRSLYDRPNPVDDRKMLAYRRRLKIVLVMAVLALLGCLTGNIATFALLGIGFLIAILCGLGLTALAVVVGHLVHEWVVSRNWWLKVVIASAVAVLFFSGLFIFTQARSAMMDRVVSAPPQTSYVDGEDDAKATPEPRAHTSSELEIRHAMGAGMLLMMLAADLALAFLVGWLIEMYSDDDFTAWTVLQTLTDRIIDLEERIARIGASFEVNRKRCLGGILRAHNDIERRNPPYHRALALLLATIFLFAHHASAQVVRYEAILIDMSASISHGDKKNELFRQYVAATKKLLLTEPPNTRVWVLGISSDSFAGTQEILKGWTPESHGVFNDDLDRARRELAADFEKKTTRMFPVARSTDVFGALSRVNVLFESGNVADQSASKDVWIFSDMMNDTKKFSMSERDWTTAEEMLDNAKGEGLLIPLKGYSIHICGVSTASMSAHRWMIIKRFWESYFASVGAETLVYSADVTSDR